MIKEIPTFYSANPEFRGKTNPNQLPDQSAATGTAKPSAKGAVDKKADAVKRAQEIIEQGGEINALDAKQLSIDSEEKGKSSSKKRVFCDDKAYLSLPI